MMNFCTLFDSKYLDKGLLLYRSLEHCTDNFKLFIFCFDKKSFDVLEKMNLKKGVLIKEEDIETPEVLKAKKNRTRAEYCWTCSTIIIEYILDNYDVDNCTYIDSDLYFYKDPSVLLNELRDEEHVIITPHRLTDSPKDIRTAKRYGTYCVEFNYFDQSEQSRKVLSWWKEQCLAWCYCKVEDGKYGDQKYLDYFQTKFTGVHVLNNLGGGVAPWNLKQYDLVCAKGDNICLKERKSGKEFDLVFFHFQSIRYFSNGKVNIHSGTSDQMLKKKIYFPYLYRTILVRKELNNYGIEFSKPIVHAGSLLKMVYQKYIRPHMVRNSSDIVDLNLVAQTCHDIISIGEFNQ